MAQADSVRQSVPQRLAHQALGLLEDLLEVTGIMEALAIGSDNLVEVDELTNESTDAYVNNATIIMTLKDSSLDAVPNAEDLSLAYVAGSNGKYQGTIPSTVSLTAGSRYYLDISATGGGVTLFVRIPCRAQYIQQAP